MHKQYVPSYVFVGFEVIKTINSYRTRDYETAEKHPDGIESRGNNGSYVHIRSQSYRHHSVVCIVQKCEEHEEEKPQELGCLPFEVDHCIHDHSIHHGLNKYVWHFDQYLHNIIDIFQLAMKEELKKLTTIDSKDEIR